MEKQEKLRSEWYDKIIQRQVANRATNEDLQYNDLCTMAAHVYMNNETRDPEVGYQNVNDWLQDVMNLKAAACQNCLNVWTYGIAGKTASSGDEARVSAHANGWLVQDDKVLCPKCREEK